MTIRRIVLAGCLLLLVGGGVVAWWQYRERTAPSYSELIFGPEGHLRVMVVVVEEQVYLVPSGKGSPTNPRNWESLAPDENRVLQDPDGRTQYTLLRVQYQPYDPEMPLAVDVQMDGPASYRQYAFPGTSRNVTKAPQTHFHGPLAVEKLSAPSMVPGGEAVDVRVSVVTRDDSRGCWAAVRSHELVEQKSKPLFGPEVAPVVEIDFPAKEAGGAPIRRRFVLTEAC
ncbi:MAG: hypothetical protein U0840_23960 [Gemmataceae bacterium]